MEQSCRAKRAPSWRQSSLCVFYQKTHQSLKEKSAIRQHSLCVIISDGSGRSTETSNAMTMRLWHWLISSSGKKRGLRSNLLSHGKRERKSQREREIKHLFVQSPYRSAFLHVKVESPPQYGEQVVKESDLWRVLFAQVGNPGLPCVYIRGKGTL